MIADKSGNCATIEFVKGKTIIHQRQDLSFNVLTNNTVQDSKSYLQKFSDFGGKRVIHKTNESKNRYVRTCEQMNSYKGENVIEYAFKSLKEVTYNITVWSIVYDMNNLTIHFNTNKNQNRRFFTFDNFDFTCTNNTRALDINTPISGNISSKFKQYSYSKNKEFINSAFEEIDFLSDVPRGFIDKLITYPNTVKCK